MTECEAVAYAYCLEYAQHTPPHKWNLSPEMKEWVCKLIIHVDEIKEQEKHL
jgi:hypothetical protein